MPAPAVSSAPSLRVLTWAPDGWARVPASSLDDGAWGIHARADDPRLVRVFKGQVRDVRTSPQGLAAVEALTFVLGALINAPVVSEAAPAARAGRPSRSSRRLLIFSPARWQWESAERTGAKPGDVFRLIERSGKPVGIDGTPGPAVFRWSGEAGEEVPYEVEDLGPTLTQSEIIRQGFAWLGVQIDHSAEMPTPEPSEESAAAPTTPRRRRVMARPPPPARRALSSVPLDDDHEGEPAPVPIPDLPPEPPAIDDDPTQEFPNMPANRAPTPTPTADEAADEAVPAEIKLREPTPEEMARVRAKFDGGQINAAIDLYMDLCGWPEGTGREAEAHMMEALGRRKPSAPARRGAGGGVPSLHLVSSAPIQSAPIDEEEREHLERVVAGYDATAEADLKDYDAAQAAAADSEPMAPEVSEADDEDDDPESEEQIRTIPVSLPGPTRATFTRDDGTEPGLDDGRDAYVYEEPPPALGRPLARGDVLPKYGRCVSVMQRNEVIELTEEEREAFVVELTEMPALFGALEERRRKVMAELKEAKTLLQKREIHLGDAIRTFKELRPVQVAGLLKDGWVTEIDANNPERIFGTRKPNENDQLQEDLFDRHRDEDEDGDSDSDEGEDE